MKYIARILSEIQYSPNSWKGLKVGIFKIENNLEEQIGEYERNYSSLFNTFFHFRRNKRDFALYSPDYTVTRILELPSCKDIGGEEPSSGGFCPFDYFVPTFIEQEIISETTGLNGTNKRDVKRTIINNPIDEMLSEAVCKMPFTNYNTGEQCETVTTYRPLTSPSSHPFGFVAGCIWGDDSSWKIQYLDLSKVEDGIVKREERFGYIALPENQSLKEAIDMYDFGHDSKEDYSNYIRINIMQTFDLRDGKTINPLD